MGVLLLGAFAAGCGRDAEPPDSGGQAPVFKPVDPSQAATFFNQPGTSRYAGVLPCADCAGIRTELILLQDAASGEPQVYELRETHLGSMSTDGEKTSTSRGRWAIDRGVPGDEEATVYRLDGGDRAAAARRFERLNDGELRLLDPSGRRIVSEANYVLSKVSEPPMLTLPTPPGTVPAPAPAAADADGPVAMVTDMASGWPVMLRIGQKMTARLATDRQAGLRWSLRAGSDGGVVVLDGAAVYEASPGGGGTEVFRLRAVTSGKTTLTFDQKKDGSAEALRTVSYPVTVP